MDDELIAAVGGRSRDRCAPRAGGARPRRGPGAVARRRPRDDLPLRSGLPAGAAGAAGSAGGAPRGGRAGPAARVERERPGGDRRLPAGLGLRTRRGALARAQPRRGGDSRGQWHGPGGRLGGAHRGARGEGTDGGGAAGQRRPAVSRRPAGSPSPDRRRRRGGVRTWSGHDRAALDVPGPQPHHRRAVGDDRGGRGRRALRGDGHGAGGAARSAGRSGPCRVGSSRRRRPAPTGCWRPARASCAGHRTCWTQCSAPGYAPPLLRRAWNRRRSCGRCSRPLRRDARPRRRSPAPACARIRASRRWQRSSWAGSSGAAPVVGSPSCRDLARCAVMHKPSCGPSRHRP